MQEVQFDHLGDFTYSREEGTAAYKYADQIAEETKKARRDEIMTLQKKISHDRNKLLKGQILEGLVTNYDPTQKEYCLRSYWNAPDDVDGNIYFTSAKPHKTGDIVKVKITEVFIYDLRGEEVE
jgi:ribosomal protein S12 methylthiotransferase